ncbi:hypothetical protein AWENTII_009543 [Aspergillus wentii]
MAIPEIKEMKAQWHAEVQPEYTLKDVAAHNLKDDIWIVIHGQVFDITKYMQDHPGGADVLVEVAGSDATAAYEDIGHSEDAREIMQPYMIGTLQNAKEYIRPQAVRVITQKPVEKPRSAIGTVSKVVGAMSALSSLVYIYHRGILGPFGINKFLPQQLSSIRLPRGGFTNGFLTATVISAAVGSVIAQQVAKFTKIESGFTRYPPHIKARKVVRIGPHLAKGFLDPKEYQCLPLVQKDQLSPNVYRFVFALPDANDIIGLPIGQHVAIRAVIDGLTVTRSYTPVSNNIDRGRLELVVKCYPDGLLSGRYLANLTVGDEVEFRGPKGAMRYSKGHCQKLGMVAGGTGITPMYQLIRAICENDRDTTEISLVYANRSEGDILLREELESFARRYPNNFKLWYMLDAPSEGWTYGTGYVNQAVLTEHMPAPSPDTKILLCGPPVMVNATKKTLASMGFQTPGSVSKMSDQIFCF